MNDIQRFLADTSPFDQLPSDELEKLSTKLTSFRYRMGQPILVREKLLHQIAILYEGQARLLGYDPRNNIPITLELLKPGAVIGSVNLVRGLPCETAIASTEVVCLTLTYQEFLQLLEKYPQLQSSFRNQCSLIEVFDLIGYQLEKQARGDTNLKQLALEAISEAQIYHLPPGKTKLGKEVTALLEDSNLTWFVSGGGTIANFPPRSHLNLREKQKFIEVQGVNPARLLGFPTNQWSQITTSYSSSPITQEQAKHPTEESPVIDIPYAEVGQLGEEIATQQQKDKKKEARKNYPYVQGRTPLGAAVACFQMLSQYFGMPFRKEVIRRVLAEQLQRNNNLSLPLCGAIVELMGLNAQLVNIPSTAITRLSAPVLVRWQERLAILYEISDESLVIGSPEMGILRRKPADFLDSWGEEGQVLLLQKTKETPQERFGLRWFVPSLIRYRWVLLQASIADVSALAAGAATASCRGFFAFTIASLIAAVSCFFSKG
ncbi:MAG: cyclic nucleotide-binding domain-containing protein, partial [Moorea sp. SIO2B7]|nr:cyclic nucleotide-binding domain-containing protein [Moorena sp. SIO2B7]